VHLDIGAGDGRYVLQRAQVDPCTSFFGLDPNHAGLVEVSQRAARVKGDCNAWFVLGAFDDLPGQFEGHVDYLTVLFPWGSLLRAMAEPTEQDRLRMARLCARSAKVEIVAAIDLAADCGELTRLGLADFSMKRMAERWASPQFEVAGLERLDANHPYQTTWWRKIRQRESREAWRLSLRFTSETT